MSGPKEATVILPLGYGVRGGPGPRQLTVTPPDVPEVTDPVLRDGLGIFTAQFQAGFVVDLPEVPDLKKFKRTTTGAFQVHVWCSIRFGILNCVLRCSPFPIWSVRPQILFLLILNECG